MEGVWTNFGKGAYLIFFGVFVGWFGIEVQNGSCGSFGSGLLCASANFAILAAVAILLVGAVYAGVSLWDFFRHRR